MPHSDSEQTPASDEQTIDPAGLIPGSGTQEPAPPLPTREERLQAGLDARTARLDIAPVAPNLGATLGFGGSIAPSQPQPGAPLIDRSARSAAILSTPEGGGRITIRGETTTLQPDGTLLDDSGSPVGRLSGFRSEAPPNDVEALVGNLQTAGEKLIAGRALRNQKEARDSLSADLKQRQGEVRSLRKEQSSLMDQISSLNKAADNEDRRANKVESGSTFEATGSTRRENAAQAAQKRRLATQLRSRAAQLQAQLGPSQDNIERTKDQANELQQNQGKAGEDAIADAALRIEADREARNKAGARATQAISPFKPNPDIVSALPDARREVKAAESQAQGQVDDINEQLGAGFSQLAVSSGITSIVADFDTGTLVGTNAEGNRVAGANLLKALGNTAVAQQLSQDVAGVSRARDTEDAMSILSLSSAPPGMDSEEFVNTVRRLRDLVAQQPNSFPFDATLNPTAWAVRELTTQAASDQALAVSGGK